MADLPGIFLLRGKAPGDKPANGRLRAGEIGINEYDKILFLHNPSSTAPIKIDLAGLSGDVVGLGKVTRDFAGDWNAEIYAAGIHDALMLGTATNGPGVGDWLYVFTILYKDTGNFTQVAFPYRGAVGVFMRAKLSGVYGPWVNLADGCDAATVGGLTPAQLRGVRVQNHVTTAHVYAAAADLQIDALNTAISCSAGDTVKITATINFENNPNGAFYLKRNGVEIGSAAAASHSGLCAVPYDVDGSTTMGVAAFSFIDESPVSELNTYTFHRRGDSAPFYLNRTATGDAGTSMYNERATSTIILET